MRRVLGWLIGAVTVLGLVPDDARATFPGGVGPIAFAGNGGVYVVGPEGGVAARRVSDGDGPRFSPDGGRLVYRTGFAIRVADVEGTGYTELPHLGIDPTWSADGRIVFTFYKSGDPRINEIAVANPDGSGLQILSDHPGDYSIGSRAVAAADGTIFYDFRDARTTNFDVWKVPPGGGANQPVLDGAGSENVLDVSPDSSALLYSVPAQKQMRMRMLATGVDTVVTTTTANGGIGSAAFSPDGAEIVYATGSAADTLRRVNPDGTQDRPFTVTYSTAGSAYFTKVAWGVGGIVVTETTDEANAVDGDARCDVDLQTAGSQCTLRAAIETANAQDGEDSISFRIGEDGGRQTIAVEDALPESTGTVTIDGTTQPGVAAGEPGVAVDGSGAGTVDGLRILGEDSTVRGLDLHGFAKTAIVLAGDGGHTVEANWIGFKPATGGGYERAGNGSGVDVAAPDVTVGGPTTAERNVISANGNAAGAKSYVDGLDGDVSQGTLHDTFVNLGTGVIVSDDDAAHVDITGNWLGVDPAGGRFGQPDGLTSTFGVMVGPEGGILTDVEVSENLISGNLFGVLGAPDTATTSVVDGLRIAGNRIGTTPSGGAGPGLGGAIGVALLDKVSNAVVEDNAIHGQVLGISAAKAAPTVRGNTIGTDENLGGLVSGLQAGSATLGLHNLFGVLLADTQGATVGGPGAQGNRILGNVVGVMATGPASAGNAVLGNTIGLATDPGVAAADRTVADAGSAIGVLLDGGTGNDVGDPEAGNLIQATGIAVLGGGVAGGHVQDNRLNANAIGVAGAQAQDWQLGGGPAAGNELTANAIGAFLLGWSPTARELAAAKLGQENAAREQDRELALTAPQAQGALGFVDATSAATVDGGAVDLGTPPGGVGAARAAGQRRASTGVRIAGNSIGTTKAGTAAPNYVGAWLAGTHTDTTVVDNTIARNYGGGLWVGSPAALGSSVPEPSGVTVRANRIFENFSPGNSLTGIPALGLDLLEPKPQELVQQAFGVTANDAGDTDVGANGRQNTPLVTGAVRSGDQVTISGTLASAPNTSYGVELFADQRCNAFGSGEGELPVGGGPVTVITDGAGNGAFVKTVTAATAYTRVTATATGPEGTSEFSPCAAIGDALPPVADPGPGAPGPGPAASQTPAPFRTPAATPDTTRPPLVAGPQGKPDAGGPVTVRVTSGEDATLTATGSQWVSAGKGARASAAKRLSVKLKRRKLAVKARKAVRVTLKPSGRSAIKRLKRAVRRGGKATATIKLVLVDRAGNRSTRTLRIKLR